MLGLSIKDFELIKKLAKEKISELKIKEVQGFLQQRGLRTVLYLRDKTSHVGIAIAIETMNTAQIYSDIICLNPDELISFINAKGETLLNNGTVLPISDLEMSLPVVLQSLRNNERSGCVILADYKFFNKNHKDFLSKHISFANTFETQLNGLKFIANAESKGFYSVNCLISVKE